jgi:hypothetical protein
MTFRRAAPSTQRELSWRSSPTSAAVRRRPEEGPSGDESVPIIECQGGVELKPAFQFLNRDKDLAAAPDHAQLVPYVLIEEVARHRKLLGGFVDGESEAWHSPFVFSHVVRAALA